MYGVTSWKRPGSYRLSKFKRRSLDESMASRMACTIDGWIIPDRHRSMTEGNKRVLGALLRYSQFSHSGSLYRHGPKAPARSRLVTYFNLLKRVQSSDQMALALGSQAGCSVQVKSWVRFASPGAL